jgi:hypothetical protein
MKTIVRFTIIALLLAVIVPILPASAQEGDQLTGASTPITAVYFQSATAGSFADQGDGTYLLSLEGVAPEIVWLVTTPALGVETMDLSNLNAQWAAAESLQTEAVLEVGDLNVHLMLSAPTYDAASGVQTYTSTVVSISAPEGVKEPDLPASFDGANLSIVWSLDFQSSLMGGIEALFAGVRATPEECAAAQTAFNDFIAWYLAQQPQVQSLGQACNAGDQASCAAAKQLADQVNAAYIAIYPTITLLNTQCK